MATAARFAPAGGVFTTVHEGKHTSGWRCVPQARIFVLLDGGLLDGYARDGHGNRAPQLLVLISEHVRTKRGLWRLWRFLGVSRKATNSSFDRIGTYKHGNLSTWAIRRLYAAYRSSTQRVYATLGRPIDEWEGFYARHNAAVPAGAKPRRTGWRQWMTAVSQSAAGSIP